MLAPVVCADGFDRGREPDSGVVDVRVKEWHEGPHGVVAFVIGIDGRRELEVFVFHPGHAVGVVVQVEGCGDTDLVEVGEAGGSEGEVTGAGEAGEEKAGEDSNDGDRDEEFDEGKAG
ncbi:MAG: hypothetical protein RI897_159 [Verrucomicrobiota bacterium]